MANISIKKDFEDGQKLFAQQLNNNFETIEMGINSGNKIIWKDDNGAEFQTFRGTTAEIEKRPIIDGQTLYNIETGEMLLDTEDARRTINKPLWKDDNTSEVTSFKGTTEEIAARPIIDGQKLYNIENGDTFLDVGETRKAMNKQLWNDNGAEFQTFRGTAEEIAARPIIDGQTLYNIETGETALDVGGKRISTGAGNVVYIGDEEPQNDATKIWIENDQVLNLGSEVAISSEEPTTQEKLWIQRGKNLIDISSLSNGYVAADGTLSSVVNYGERKSNYIKVEPNTTYTFKAFETTDRYPDWYGIGEYTLDKQFIKRLAQSTGNQYITFTTSETTRYIVLSATYLADVTKVQLEKGSVATEYEPYTRKIHTKTDNGYEEFYNEENREIYDNYEQRIGTHMGMPLYRKTIGGKLPTTNNWEVQELGIDNLQYVVRHDFYFDNSSHQRYKAPFYESSSYYVLYSVNDIENDSTYKNHVSIKQNGFSGLAYRIDIEYTKTTD